MLFFFKKKTITIDFVVPAEFSYVAEYSPVRKASKFVPEWYRNVRPSSVNELLERGIYDRESGSFKPPETNVRGCVGIKGALTKGMIIPLWSDLLVETFKDDTSYTYYFSDGKSSMEEHKNQQLGNFSNNYYHLKLKSPWVMAASRPFEYIYLPLTYHTGLDVNYLPYPAITHTISKYNSAGVNAFIVVKKDEDRKLLIKQNSPVVHMVPITESEVKFNNVVDTDYYYKLFALHNQMKFINKGFTQKLFDKKYNDEESKCPFSRFKL